jgi:hypothetical protein
MNLQTVLTCVALLGVVAVSGCADPGEEEETESSSQELKLAEPKRDDMPPRTECRADSYENSEDTGRPFTLLENYAGRQVFGRDDRLHAIVFDVHPMSVRHGDIVMMNIKSRSDDSKVLVLSLIKAPTQTGGKNVVVDEQVHGPRKFSEEGEIGLASKVKHAGTYYFEFQGSNPGEIYDYTICVRPGTAAHH